MIENIIRYSVRNKLVIGLFMLVWIVWGIVSLFDLSIDAVPDITDNQVRVITTVPTLATQEVEQFVTYPVELALANLPGVVEMRSVSKMGLSIVTIVFEDGLGTYRPRQLVSEQLEVVRNDIPSDFGVPSIAPITTGLGEIYQYSLVADEEHKDEYDAMDLRTIQDWIVKRQLSGVPGVVEINSVGGFVKQYEVAINPEQLRSMDLTINKVMDALERNNRNTGGSYVERGPEALFIRGEGLAQSLEDLENIVVDTQNKVPILIRDVADVRYGHAVRFGAMTRNGEGEAVGGQVLMLKGENSDKVITNVKKRIEEIQVSLPEGVRIKPFIDRTRLINKTTSTVTENLLLGALIVIFFLVLLLGNLRSGLIVASVIPLSMLFAVGMMRVFGVSANLMSLGALDFGIIIDGAVIIVEFTVYLIASQKTELSKFKGDQLQKKIDEIAISSGNRMMSSAFFGQLIILIVFVPILTLTGVEGKMFQPMAFTFGFAMIGAILLCLTYVPAVSAVFLKSGDKGDLTFSKNAMDFLAYRLYRPTVITALRYKGAVIGGSVLLLVISMILFNRMGGEFIPQLDEGDMAVHPITKPGTSLSQVIENNTRMEKLLLDEFPEVTEVVSRIGTAEIPTDPMSLEMSDMFIILKDKSEWVSAETRDELIEKMRTTLSSFPGYEFAFTQPIEMRFNELMTGVREDIAVKIYGDDLSVLAELGNQAQEIIRDLPGVADINLEQVVGLPQLKVSYDRLKMARYGVDVETVNRLIQSAYAGGQAGVIYEGERRFDLVVRLTDPYISDLEAIRNLYAVSYDGDQIPLEELADIRYEEGPAQISRDNTRRRIVVGVNAGSQDVQTLVEDIQRSLNTQLNLPSGYNITYGGQFENLERAQARLMFAVPLALGLIFILLYFSLKSAKQALLVFSAIPLAAIGGVFALWFRGLPFSISAGVGFIVLFGIAVLNGIILISFLNELKQAGIQNVNRQILMGTRQRLRPVLLTAATDMFGFMPMALSTAAGAEVQRPLATVVIGGLITATLLTLVVLPVLYSLVEERRYRFKPVVWAVSLFILFGISVPAFSQSADSTITLTQQGAVELALDRHPDLEKAVLEVQRRSILEGTAFDLPATQFSYSEEEVGGNHQGIQSFNVQQSMDFPLTYLREIEAAQARTELSEDHLRLARLQLVRDVRRAWQEWRYHMERVRLYESLSQTYEDVDLAANLRFELGEIDRLEHVSSQFLYDETIAKYEAAVDDVVIAEDRLQNLMVTDLDLVLPDTEYVPLDLGVTSQSVSPSHILLQSQQHLIDIREKETAVARSELWPDLFGGYKWQNINNASGFYAWEIGIRIPIWVGPELNRIRAGKIEEQKARLELRSLDLNLKSRYIESLRNTEKWRRQYDLNHIQRNEIAEELRSSATRRFENGDIDYLSYARYIEQAVQIEENYLVVLLRLNQSIIDLQFYLETE